MENKEEKKYTKKDKWLWIGGIILIDLILICVWLFTSSKDEQFASHFSFASTVTSIILSVLAIFMSVSNESKTQTIREKIEQEAETITKTADDLKTQITSLSGKMDYVVTSQSNLEHQINTNIIHADIAFGEQRGEQ